MSYKEISAIARKRRDDRLPAKYLLSDAQLSQLPKDVTGITKDPSLFSAVETEIVNTPATQILSKIHSGAWKSETVTEAFIHAATVAQQLTNCLTEVLFDEARTRAKELDAYLATNGSITGPLHGLPISLKDCIVTPPHPSAIGIADNAIEPTKPEQEAVLAKLLRSLGAVLYVKTNVPTAMMMIETDNRVTGPTLNPYNRKLSPGGSSGGEGALLAMRGSPLGIGTDIAGSIRVPAAFCNMYGLKPSNMRFPVVGFRIAIPGQEFIIGVNGPLSPSLESLSLYSSAMLSTSSAPWEHDPKCIPLPWQTTPQILPRGRKLRLGIIASGADGKVTPHPPVERALRMTRQALEAQGHEVIDWEPHSHPELEALMMATFYDIGGTAIQPAVDKNDEPWLPALLPYKTVAEHVSKHGVSLTPDVQRERAMYKTGLQKAYLDRWHATADPANGKAAIDGIIAAVTPWAAPRQHAIIGSEKTHYMGYTGFANVLDYPGCTFPVTRVDAAVDLKRENFTPLTSQDELIQADYDAEFYDGAPVALQLVGERLREEKVLEVVAVIRDCLIASDGIQR